MTNTFIESNIESLDPACVYQTTLVYIFYDALHYAASVLFHVRCFYCLSDGEKIEFLQYPTVILYVH